MNLLLTNQLLYPFMKCFSALMPIILVVGLILQAVNESLNHVEVKISLRLVED